MASLLRNQTGVSRTPTILTASSSNVYINQNEYLFYSNSPETLDANDMADNTKFLNKVSVSGNGQVYTWHANGTGRTINNCILIYNPNNYDVTLQVTNYGLTNDSTKSLPDANAWEKYYNGQNTSVTVAAGGYGNLFLRSIASGNHFGIVARINIVKKGTTNSASVVLYDLAYFSNSGNAQYFATADPADTKRARGKGNGFYVTIDLPTVAPTNTNGVGYSIAAASDAFGGVDCAYITDPSGSTSGRFQGAYGQQFQITIPIKNNTGTARKFRIYIGSRGGDAFPFVYFAKGIVKYNDRMTYYVYKDVIETDVIPNGSTIPVTFSTVVTAMAATPYFIGVRTV